MRPRKLTDEEILWVRRVYVTLRSLPTGAQMAKDLGVSRQLISQIANGTVYPELCDTVSGFDGAQLLARPRRSL